MRFKYIEMSELPRLAWCARLTSNGEITVTHGPGVETHENWFFEGAWDGPFSEHGFANATDCFGTGGCIENDKAVFVSPSHTMRALITFNAKRRYILISNSIPFIVAQMNDTPDITYTKYFKELFLNLQNGCGSKSIPLKMRKGKRLLVHAYCNIEIQNNNVTKVAKPVPEPPVDYDDFRQRMINMLSGIHANATDSARKRTYEPLITLSRGYDSVACAAMASAAGWRKAITLVPEDPDDETINDDGAPIAEALDLSVERLMQQNWRMRTDIPEAEFVATAWAGIMIRFSGIEQRLQDTLLIMGNLGGLVWDPNSGGVDHNWKRPRKQQMGGESLWEFQLRVGFIIVFPATFLAVHYDVLKEIMTSDEMQAWSVGGEYNRPLPRRLAEEMGVARELFGQEKMASSHQYFNKISSRSGHRDFIQYLKEVGMYDQMVEVKILNNRKKQGINLDKIYQYFFHWGIDRTRLRYMIGDKATIRSNMDIDSD